MISPYLWPWSPGMFVQLVMLESNYIWNCLAITNYRETLTKFFHMIELIESNKLLMNKSN